MPGLEEGLNQDETNQEPEQNQVPGGAEQQPDLMNQGAETQDPRAAIDEGREATNTRIENIIGPEMLAGNPDEKNEPAPTAEQMPAEPPQTEAQMPTPEQMPPAEPGAAPASEVPEEAEAQKAA